MRIVNKIEAKTPQMPRRKRVAAYARASMESKRLQHSLSAQVSFYSSLIPVSYTHLVWSATARQS